METSEHHITAKVPRVLLPNNYSGKTDWEGLTECRISVAEGKVVSVEATQGMGGAADFNFKNSILLPGFLDSHTHLDKAHSWNRTPNRSGTFNEALHNLHEDKDHWSVEDVYQRANYSLECAYAYGTVALRTHVDTGLPWAERSYKALSRLKNEWAGRVELQMASLASVEEYSTGTGAALADLPANYGAHSIGGMTIMNPKLDQQLDRMMELAVERGVGLDFHVDENNIESVNCLKSIAEAIIRNAFPNTVVCGHCCNLAVKPLDEQLATLELVKRSGLKIVSLPMCNLYLQDRRVEGDAIQTPYWRGVTLAHEFMELGVPFACASDNVRDSFYAFGDFDMLEVYRESVRIAHLDRKLQQSITIATSAPADLMDLSADGYGVIAPGSPAKFTVLDASSMSELLSRPLIKRSLFRDDHLAEFGLPPYSEIGPLSGT